ncbi:hypothetical protein ABT063_24875 [Streptomyces sp. NPDC002838]|uniref:hypothetical protein n=1 Tax=Streptomyces sp. NPDC002838 TaxID=3154436 RepID=UPI00331BE0DE
MTTIIDTPELGRLLVESAARDRDRIAAQALAEEETILALPKVRRLLVVEDRGRPTARWENLMGHQYTLNLNRPQFAFLGLVLSILSMGHIALAAVEDLDERRLLIIQRAILQLSGNNTIAVGTRV